MPSYSEFVSWHYTVCIYHQYFNSLFCFSGTLLALYRVKFRISGHNMFLFFVIILGVFLSV